VGDHPVKVPAELIGEWLVNAEGLAFPNEWAIYVAAKAAQWAWDQREPELQERADQELEASNNWLVLNGYGEAASRLCAARRPKPPTLAEQGMEALNKGCFPSNDEIATIRAALNRLAELEANQ